MPADILLISTDGGSAFFDTVSLDGETILTERFASSPNVSSGNLQTMKGMIMYEDPNLVMHKFNGIFSINNQEFQDISNRNFAMRGSVLKNTNFIIGIVLYVGTDTKAYQNSKTRKRKQSWLIGRMHELIVKMFWVIAALSLILALGGVAFQAMVDVPYVYKDVSSLVSNVTRFNVI